jgi:1,6-anhydro-N-acetylmuramate kinase
MESLILTSGQSRVLQELAQAQQQAKNQLDAAVAMLLASRDLTPQDVKDIQLNGNRLSYALVATEPVPPLRLEPDDNAKEETPA